jgi:hypothetical protein
VSPADASPPFAPDEDPAPISAFGDVPALESDRDLGGGNLDIQFDPEPQPPEPDAAGLQGQLEDQTDSAPPVTITGAGGAATASLDNIVSDQSLGRLSPARPSLDATELSDSALGSLPGDADA